MERDRGELTARREGKTGILPDVQMLLTEVAANLQGDFSAKGGVRIENSELRIQNSLLFYLTLEI